MKWTSAITFTVLLAFAVILGVEGQRRDGVYYVPYRRPSIFEVAPRVSPRSSSSRKVKVDVYYETDCPDSMNFITTQLFPTYQKMEDIMDVHLIPYGKATEVALSDGGYKFQCHHGPSECYGNVVQNCAIRMYSVKDHVSFVNCMESYPKPSQNGEKCARRLGLEWAEIKKCAEGTAGMRLQHTSAVMTESLKPPLYFVPWIILNNEYTDKSHRLAFRDLQFAVCEAYKGPTHPNCPKKIPEF